MFILLFVLSDSLKWCKIENTIVCVYTNVECPTSYGWSVEGFLISISEYDMYTTIGCGINTEHNVNLPDGTELKMKFTNKQKEFRLEDYLVNKKTEIKRDTCNIANCNICSQNNPNFCYICNDNYYLANRILPECVPCKNAICKQCNSNPSVCSSCYDGLYLNNEFECDYCSSNCKTCSSKEMCTDCNTGKYLYNGKCLSCQYCYNCETQTGCRQCWNGYYQENNGCTPCDSNCKTCSLQSTNCLSCKQGSYIQNNKCLMCSSYCTTNKCDTIQGCTECMNGYYKNNMTCFKCHEECLTCLNNQVNGCLTCENGRYFNNNQCVECDDNCEINMCDVVSGCQKCKIGYFPEEKRCSPCSKMPNCKTCSQTEKYQCISCVDRFVVNDYQCECPNHLYQNTSSTCDECYKNKSNCKLCQKYGNYEAECKVCYPPFELKEGSCVECQSKTNYIGNICVNNNGNCELQNGENECLKCPTDFYLRNKTCKPFDNKNLCETNSKITCENCGNGITTTG
ncbi:hypothetical protein EIN_263190, partial [Entamoeba invadens IP1]